MIFSFELLPVILSLTFTIINQILSKINQPKEKHVLYEEIDKGFLDAFYHNLTLSP
jgi:hypothetical protein